MTWNSWVNLIVGILLIISPFVLGFSGNITATWTAVIAGIVVALVSVLPGLLRVKKTAADSSMR